MLKSPVEKTQLIKVKRPEQKGLVWKLYPWLEEAMTINAIFQGKKCMREEN